MSDPIKEIFELLHALQVALKNIQLYSEAHPRSSEGVEAIDRAFRLAIGDRDRLALMVTRGKMFLDGKPIPATVHATALSSQLQARGLNGVVFTAGVEKPELVSLLRVLALKPQALEARGGADSLLAESGVTHIRFPAVRYEEVSEGEEIVPEGLLEQGGVSLEEEGDRLISARQFLTNVLVPLLQVMRPGLEESDAAASSSPAKISGQAGAGPEAPGAGVGVAGSGLGLSETAGDGRLSASTQLSSRLSAANLSQASVAELLPEILISLSGRQQGALLLGVGDLRAGPLKDGLSQIAPQMLGNAADDVLASGKSDVAFLAEALETLVRAVPARERGVEVLRAKLDAAGMSRDDIDELIELMSWDELDEAARVEKLLGGNFIIRFPSYKLIAFLHQLVESNRAADLVKILDRYSRGLFANAPAVRKRVAEGFMAITGSGTIASVAEASGLIERVVFTHFLRETDVNIQTLSRGSMVNLFAFWLRQRMVDHVYRNLLKINGAVGSLSAEQPWKRDSFTELLDGLVEKPRVEPLIAMIRETEPEQLPVEAAPLLHFLGSRIAGPLLEALEEEQERSRRSRLVKTLRALGAQAIDELRGALQSPVWYLVRNAITVLGESGAQEVVTDIGGTLHHPDARVKRAAIRALTRIGGGSAERELSAALYENEPATQGEILQALASMRARGAVFDVCTLLKDRHVDGPVRVLAADMLGQVGSTEAISYLSEVLRRRGRIGGETADLRAAAAEALMNIGDGEARDVVASVLESEPRGPARELIQRSFQRSRPRSGA
ncbi:MAG: HEAT repeat domain-containing protein [Acidobacteriota bacterium]